MPGSLLEAVVLLGCATGVLESCGRHVVMSRVGRADSDRETAAATPERGPRYCVQDGPAPRRECVPTPLQTDLGWCVASPAHRCGALAARSGSPMKERRLF